MYLPMEWMEKCYVDMRNGKMGAEELSEVPFKALPEDIKAYFGTPKKMMDFVLGENFLKKNLVETTGNSNLEVADKFNEFVGEKMVNYAEYAGMTLNDIRHGKVNLKTEMADVMAAPVLFDEWAHHKQVYRMDKDFATALMNTEKLEFTRDMLTHLPYNLFYLDMSEMDLKDMHGAFVYVLVEGNKCFVTIYFLAYDLIFFSHYIGLCFGEDGSGVFNKSDINEVKPYVLPAVKEFEGERLSSEYNFSRRDLVALVMQTLAYVSSTEPQVEESNDTKHTYKPNKNGGRVKNRWSELQIFDVGYAYGTSFRRKLAKARESYDGPIEMLGGKQRKSPRPHIRCAHWQRFRYGKGRQLLGAPVWIEPTFVGFGGIDEKMPLASVHKISGEKKK